MQSLTQNIKQGLLRKGLTVAAFARENGWRPSTVRDVIQRHAAGDKDVRGPQTRAILDRIRQVLNG